MRGDILPNKQFKITPLDLWYTIKSYKAAQEQLKNPYERALVLQELAKIYGIGGFAKCWPKIGAPSLSDYLKQHNLTEEGLQKWKKEREVIKKQVFMIPLTPADIEARSSRASPKLIEEILEHDNAFIKSARKQ